MLGSFDAAAVVAAAQSEGKIFANGARFSADSGAIWNGSGMYEVRCGLKPASFFVDGATVDLASLV